MHQNTPWCFGTGGGGSDNAVLADSGWSGKGNRAAAALLFWK